MTAPERCRSLRAPPLPGARAHRRRHPPRPCRGAQPRTGRCRHPRRRTAPHHRRRRHREDAHARLPRRAPHRHGRRPPSASSSSRSPAAPRRKCSAAPSGSSGRHQRASTAARSTRPGTACSASSAPPPASPATSRSWTRATPRTSCSSRAATSASANRKSDSPRRKRCTTSTRDTSTPSSPSRRSSSASSRSSSSTRPTSSASSPTTRAARRERNLVDYDDLLLFWALMLEQSPALADRIAGLYDHILVDEYQDTNLLQARILRGMCRRHQNITVVGDDAQSIYSFRGASFRNILDFPQQFPGHARRHARAELPVHAADPRHDQHAHLARASSASPRTLWTTRTGAEPPWLVTARDEQQQTRFVVDRILELHEEGTPLREMAVLFRAGYMSRRPRDRAHQPQDPVREVGRPQVPRSGARQGRARVPARPRESARRSELVPDPHADARHRRRDGARDDARRWPSGVGLGRVRATSRRRRARATRTANSSTLLDGSAAPNARADGGVGEDIDEIRRLYDDILARAIRSLRAAPRRSRSAARDRRGLSEPRGVPGRDRARTAAEHAGPRRSGSEAEDDALVISTVHSAKGKEWDAVFVIWAVDGWFPSSRSLDDEDELEEERRLMYVAMTRARNHLAVTYPLNVYATRRGADYSIDQLSRFLDRGVRDRCSASCRPSGAPAEPTRPITGRAADLRGRCSRRSRMGGAT